MHNQKMTQDICILIKSVYNNMFNIVNIYWSFWMMNHIVEDIVIIRFPMHSDSSNQASYNLLEHFQGNAWDCQGIQQQGRINEKQFSNRNKNVIQSIVSTHIHLRCLNAYLCSVIYNACTKNLAWPLKIVACAQTTDFHVLLYHICIYSCIANMHVLHACDLYVQLPFS